MQDDTTKTGTSPVVGEIEKILGSWLAACKAMPSLTKAEMRELRLAKPEDKHDGKS